VHAPLARLGFAEIRFADEWERALLDGALYRARRDGGAVVTPTCPAAIALVQARFPGLLPRVAPLLSPVEAAAAESPCTES
jgi:iron only hydrogenase large subunit-like protein